MPAPLPCRPPLCSCSVPQQSTIQHDTKFHWTSSSPTGPFKVGIRVWGALLAPRPPSLGLVAVCRAGSACCLPRRRCKPARLAGRRLGCCACACAAGGAEGAQGGIRKEASWLALAAGRGAAGHAVARPRCRVGCIGCRVYRALQGREVRGAERGIGVGHGKERFQSISCAVQQGKLGSTATGITPAPAAPPAPASVPKLCCMWFAQWGRCC